MGEVEGKLPPPKHPASPQKERERKRKGEREREREYNTIHFSLDLYLKQLATVTSFSQKNQ